jgi:CRP-like cAMP-binding protein
MNTKIRTAIENRILGALPDHERRHLLRYLEPFPLAAGAALYESGDLIKHVYFVNSGIVSLVVNTAEGDTLEVGIVGYEGVVGYSVYLDSDESPFKMLVQAGGNAFRMSAGTFKNECKRRGSLERIIRRYTLARMTQITQAAICNRFHTIEARLCRWLLESQDCMHSDNIYLTQSFLALMLGTHRPTVTLAAGVLQDAGLIDYSRGRVTILDRPRLEAATCECYRITRKALRRHKNI